MRIRSKIILVLGPTGVGKSSFAVRLAKKIGGEILSCDSMQIYEDMAVISQQHGMELRKSPKHHLVGTLSPSKEWNAADFVENAREIIEDIFRHKKIPIVVGGTGLYASTLIKGLFPSPEKDERLRKALYEEAKGHGKQALYERLLKIDPVYAAKIHPNDLRRIVRALEVYELTGKPISKLHDGTKGIESEYEIMMFVLNRDRSELYRRIDERVEKMFASGVVQEVKRLKKRRLSRTAKAVLGYREICDYIDGKLSLQGAKELLKKKTRHYAKRQLTWFRKEEKATWLKLSTRDKETELLKGIVQQVIV